MNSLNLMIKKIITCAIIIACSFFVSVGVNAQAEYKADTPINITFTAGLYSLIDADNLQYVPIGNDAGFSIYRSDNDQYRPDANSQWTNISGNIRIKSVNGVDVSGQQQSSPFLASVRSYSIDSVDVPVVVEDLATNAAKDPDATKNITAHFYGVSSIEGLDEICVSFPSRFYCKADPNLIYTLQNGSVVKLSEYLYWSSKELNNDNATYSTSVAGTYSSIDNLNYWDFSGIKNKSYRLLCGASTNVVNNESLGSTKDVKVVGPLDSSMCFQLSGSKSNSGCNSCGLDSGGVNEIEPYIGNGLSNPNNGGDDELPFKVNYYDSKLVKQWVYYPTMHQIDLVANHYHIYAKGKDDEDKDILIACYTGYEYPDYKTSGNTYANSVLTLANGWGIQLIRGKIKLIDLYGNIYDFGDPSVAIGDNLEINSITDAVGNVTTFTLSQKITETPCNVVTSRITYTRNSDGTIATRTENGETTTYTYIDIDGKKYIESVSISSDKMLTKTKTITYTGDGEVSSITADGVTINYTYTTTDDPDDPDTLTLPMITEETYDESDTKLSENQYVYGKTYTLITNVDLDNSANNRTVRKDYVLNPFGKKMFCYKVTDPMGNINASYLWLDSSKCTIPENFVVNTDYKATTSGLLIGKPWKTVDAKGRATLYTYDSNGNVTRTDYPNGGYETSVHNSRNQITSQTNIRGVTTTYSYSSTAPYQLASVSKAGTTLTNYEYYDSTDPYCQAGRLKKETVPFDGNNSKITTYEYYALDANNDVILYNKPVRTTYQYYNPSTSTYNTATVTSNYDEDGDLVSTTDANNRTVSYTTVKSDTEIRKNIIYVTGKSSQEVYDCCHLLSSSDEEGAITYYSYDTAGRLKTTWQDFTGQSETTPIIENNYNTLGERTSVVTRSNASTTRTTSYIYDKLGRVTRIDYPSALGYEAFDYDAVGNKIWSRNGKGEYTAYKYDNVNRLTHVFQNYTGTTANIEAGNYPADNSANIAYTYIGYSGLINQMTDSTGTTTYSYDNFDRVASVTSGYTGKTVYYGYNVLNQKTYVRNGSDTSKQTNYTYYNNGWLKDVKMGTTTIASYTYDIIGNRTQTTLGNGTWERYTYKATDPRYLKDSVYYAYRCSSSDPIAEKGNILHSQKKTGNTYSWYDGTTGVMLKGFGYDKASRLTSYLSPDYTSSTAFAYDWAGNRTSYSAVYNNADLLTEDNRNDYTYDSNGNLTGISSPDTMSFGYNASNLMTSATRGSNTVNFYWDGAGNRVGLTTSGSVNYKFVYDYTAGIPAILEEIQGTNSTNYIREPSGALLCRVVGTNYNYYAYDELGSTLYLTDNNGYVTDKYSYDSWGNLTSQTGTTQQPFKYVGKYGYFAHYMDTTVLPYDVLITQTLSASSSRLSFLQTGVRTYFPRLGRYMQVDPIKDGLNWSAYTGDNPVNAIDPLGKWCAGLKVAADINANVPFFRVLGASASVNASLMSLVCRDICGYTTYAVLFSYCFSDLVGGEVYHKGPADDKRFNASISAGVVYAGGDNVSDYIGEDWSTSIEGSIDVGKINLGYSNDGMYSLMYKILDVKPGLGFGIGLNFGASRCRNYVLARGNF